MIMNIVNIPAIYIVVKNVLRLKKPNRPDTQTIMIITPNHPILVL